LLESQESKNNDSHGFSAHDTVPSIIKQVLRSLCLSTLRFGHHSSEECALSVNGFGIIAVADMPSTTATATRHKPKYSSRPFFLIIFIFTTIAAFNLLFHTIRRTHGLGATLSNRQISSFEQQEVSYWPPNELYQQ